MKKIAIVAAALAAFTTQAVAAPICIDSFRIRTTTVPDANHIVFHMIDGTNWKNTLRHSCPGLVFNGFVYEPFAGRDVCENLQTIRVIDDGSFCLLGTFAKEPKKT